MKKLVFLGLFVTSLILGNTCCSVYRTAKGKSEVPNPASNSRPISHETWDGLLKKHVDSAGMVNYKGFLADTAELNKYIGLLSNNHPNDQFWTKNEQKAYWINAYNAFTVQLILKNYPIASIKDIGGKIPFVNSTWDIKFIKIEGIEYDLNNIEHNILRPKFKDPRIHFAINCASKSCAKLQRGAFKAEQLDAQLDEAGRQFLNDPAGRNKVTPEKAQLSMYFKWFEDDFRAAAPSVWAFINQYSEAKMTATTPVDFLEYDWRLNERHEFH